MVAKHPEEDKVRSRALPSAQRRNHQAKEQQRGGRQQGHDVDRGVIGRIRKVRALHAEAVAELTLHPSVDGLVLKDHLAAMAHVAQYGKVIQLVVPSIQANGDELDQHEAGGEGSYEPPLLAHKAPQHEHRELRLEDAGDSKAYRGGRDLLPHPEPHAQREEEGDQRLNLPQVLRC
jgi:hypothetical protein